MIGLDIQDHWAGASEQVPVLFSLNPELFFSDQHHGTIPIPFRTFSDSSCIANALSTANAIHFFGLILYTRRFMKNKILFRE